LVTVKYFMLKGRCEVSLKEEGYAWSLTVDSNNIGVSRRKEERKRWEVKFGSVLEKEFWKLQIWPIIKKT